MTPTPSKPGPGHTALMDLFSTPVTPIVEDAEGGIRYHCGFLSPEQAQDWFDTLVQQAYWNHQRRPMYDRVVDVPRLLASYQVHSLPAHLPLAQMLAQVQAIAPAPYTTVGLNLYRDGRDSVAMHNDKLHTLVPGQAIALVSLGHARRMLIRPKSGDRRSIGIELEPGSLLTMSYAAQLTHEHGVPKTTRSVGERISVVFRVRPEGWKE